MKNENQSASALVAQISKHAVTPISKSAECVTMRGMRVWKPAPQQTGKSALQVAVIVLALLSILGSQLSICLAQGTAFTYQGRLNNSVGPASGVYDLQFTIYDSSGGPTIVGGPLTNPAVSVSNGLFAVMLDFGAGVFTGADRWLEIGVRTNGSADVYTTLNPRQPLTSSPYAIFSGAAGSVSNGVIQNPAFIGTTGNSPLLFYVNGQPALRLELNTVPDYTNAPNVIGGSLSNSVAAGVAGATIAGGGAASFLGFPFANRVNASFATVGGGGANSSSGDFATIAGGLQNRASGHSSVVSGGSYNAARGANSTIGGGNLNTVATNADRSVISGGEENTVTTNTTFSVIAGGRRNTNSGSYSAIGGGTQNAASEFYATVPGGRFNEAASWGSFAAGYRAKALHSGTFVWADSGPDTDFRSTGLNQFLIRASGGVGIGITNPATALHVVGTVTANSFTGSGAGISNVNATTLGGVNSSNFWKLGGNAGANPANGNFLGTTDNLPLEFKVNGGRALRFEPNTNGAPNIIGGSPNNFVSNGVVGATIAGGGAVISGFAKYTNSVTGSFGTVGGGAQNTASSSATVGGGFNNTASGLYATVSGGYFNTVTDNYATVSGGWVNTASGRYATVGGGDGNTASGFVATVGGGLGNTASDEEATVSGGYVNTASGVYAAVGGGRGNVASNYATTVSGGYGNTASASSATVAGGYGNTASGGSAMVAGGSYNAAAGDYSFAAGLRAKANHDGAFVWADSQLADFTSTANDQFLIRAQGGVGINNASPEAPLHVNGGGDASLTSGGNFISGLVNGRNIVIDNNEIIARTNGAASDLILNFGSGNVGIARIPTANALEVGGNASKTTAGSWLANSDARIKTGVQTITNALDKLSRVRLVQFHYTDDYRTAHPGIEDRAYLNVVAQDFQKVFPEDVKRSGEKLANGDDILQVDTYPLTIYSAAAIQELNDRVKAKESEIFALKDRLARLEAALAQVIKTK
jgi:hypothetical protein